jgi:glycosyltransferase involved in cell wall biosynthesis
MDELTLFKGAPAELLVQEKFLIANADIIFTGGKSLYESKKKLHANVHCFPSSVDQEHFAKAMNGIIVPQEIADIPSPIVGYFGVIDERINLQLVNDTAVLNPDISFVMIGPLAKIGEHDLPRQNNIYYLGMKSYEELPNYLKAFSIAMMPFALNDSTKFISPTKTLEYIAAGKSIVSTPIKDVVRDYSHCVSIVNSAEEFSNAIRSYLENPDPVSKDKAYREILEKTSWNVTVEKMNAIISKTVQS